jgi:hypothetical protein
MDIATMVMFLCSDKAGFITGENICIDGGMTKLYESTSHYDPETKQSRPVRKYLGREDPVTGELIPSSGKRGRKRDSPQDAGKASNAIEDNVIFTLKSKYEKELAARDKTISKQEALIRDLEAQKASVIRTLSSVLQKLSE